jgi:probable phosphoglycerate mutase
MAHVLLVRHARNSWVGKRLPGHTPGILLSEEGHAECRGLAERLDSYPLDAVYASSLERAVQTARYLAEPRALAVSEVPDLMDLDTGSFTGRAIDEVAKDPLWPTVMFAPSIARFPDGEGMTDMQARVVRALDTIRLAHPGGAVAVVAHADVIKSLVAHYVGLPFDLFQRLEIATASVSVLSFGHLGARLLGLNLTGSIPLPPDPNSTPPADPAATVPSLPTATPAAPNDLTAESS